MILSLLDFQEKEGNNEMKKRKKRKINTLKDKQTERTKDIISYKEV